MNKIMWLFLTALLVTCAATVLRAQKTQTASIQDNIDKVFKTRKPGWESVAAISAPLPKDCAFKLLEKKAIYNNYLDRELRKDNYETIHIEVYQAESTMQATEWLEQFKQDKEKEHESSFVFNNLKLGDQAFLGKPKKVPAEYSLINPSYTAIYRKNEFVVVVDGDVIKNVKDFAVLITPLLLSKNAPSRSLRTKL